MIRYKEEGAMRFGVDEALSKDELPDWQQQG